MTDSTIEKPYKDDSLQLLNRLAREHLHRHVKALVQAVLCMLVVAGSTAALAYMIQPALDHIFFHKDSTMLTLIPIVVIALSFLKGIATYGQSVIMKSIGQRMVMDLQVKLYSHLLYADISMFNATASGKLLSRFSNDIYMIRKNVTSVITGLARELVTLIALVGVMFYQNFELSMIAMLVMPLALYPMRRLGRRMRKVSRKTQEDLAKYVSHLDDSFQGIRIVKSHANEQGEIKRADNIMDGIFDLLMKAIRIESLPAPIMETLGGLAIALVIWYGGYQVMAGVTTTGAFFSFIAAVLMAYRPLKGLSGVNTNLQEGLAAISRIYEVLDVHPKITDAPNAVPLEIAKGKIEFDNVQFTYEEGKQALKNLSFTAEAGKRIALVGTSGSGKTTIINMITRFYDPEAGAIRIDDQDIRGVTLSSLRQSIAMVNQEATLFDDTIRANIAYGMPHASEEAIIAAAYDAAAHDFILALPQGYDTMIGQHGIRLSGGQRQRIAIARAMLKNAPILLLDEATSALDTISEQQIQQALDRLMQGRTTIVIAHRLSTIEHVDCIFVVKDGEIIESGTHADLLKKRGDYAKLYHRQFERQAVLPHQTGLASVV